MKGLSCAVLICLCVICCAIVLMCTPPATVESRSPVIGEALRYCNPLSIEASSQDGSPRGISLGDVTIVEENGSYYMFCTGGGA